MPGSNYEDLRNDVRFDALQASLEEAAELLFGKLQFDGLDPEAAADEVLRRFKRAIQYASGPAFDDAGFIPAMQLCTEAEVACWFGFSAQREGLLDRIRRWIGLARAVRAKHLLPDGSFVTAKDKPGDVDAVLLLPDDFRDQVQAGNPEAVELNQMLFTREPKELFAAEDEEDWWGWFCFFSRTREANGRCKGLIEVAM
jgi:hypothetical protein